VLFALRNAKVPLVFHNGFLDAMHLYDKFIGDLPTDHGKFCDSWIRNFPSFFDTRHLALEGKSTVFKISGNSLSLDVLHKHLSDMVAKSTSAPIRFERLGPLETSTAHGSAGYDATITAEVFMMEVDIWLRRDAAVSSRKRRKVEEREGTTVAAPEAESSPAVAKDAVDAGEDDGGGWTTIPVRKRPRPVDASADGSDGAVSVASGLISGNLLENHDVCRRLRNHMALVGTSQPALKFGQLAPATAPNLMELTSPTQKSPTLKYAASAHTAKTPLVMELLTSNASNPPPD